MQDKQNLILIVDDSATMRLLLGEALKKSHFKVVYAENGEAALETLKTIKPDAILLDVEMPGINGFQVCEAIRKLSDHLYTPIMMVTGLEDYESINKAFLAGATDFATKPINSDLIGHRVRYMVRTNAYFQDLQIAEKKVRVLNTELEKKILEIQKHAVAATRFVPQDFLKILNKKTITDIELGDCVEKTMTVLFLDICSFTTLSENLTPFDIFNFLNSLMNYLDPAIIKNHGFIDKYVGDAIMALFLEPDDALNAAIDMLTALDSFNQARQKNQQPATQVGIGINMGSLILGTVGFKDRMDCSVISDAVNIASRVQSLTRNFGIELLISEHVYQQLKHPEKFHCRSLGTTSVKGKSLPVKIYEVFNHNPTAEVQLKLKYATTFESALHHYEQKNLLEAANHFRQILTQNPHDSSAEYFLQHCL